MDPPYQRGDARVITYPMKNQQPCAKAAAGISSISDKEQSKSDTGFSEYLGVKATRPRADQADGSKFRKLSMGESAPCTIRRRCESEG